MAQILLDAERFFEAAQQRVVVVGCSVLQRTRPMVGDDDGGNAPAAEIRRAPRLPRAAACWIAGIDMVARFVEGHDDGRVAWRTPHRALHDPVHQRTSVSVATRDAPLFVFLGAVGWNVLALHAMHFIALVRHDQREVRHRAERQILVQHFEIHFVEGAVRVLLRRSEGVEAGVLGGVECRRQMLGVARLRPDHLHRARRRQAFEIAFPGQVFFFELVGEAWCIDRMIGEVRCIRPLAHRICLMRLAEIRVVVMDAESVPAQHGDIVSLARMHHAVILRRQAILLGECREPRRKRLADDVGKPLVLLDDDEDVVVVRHRMPCRCFRCLHHGRR